MYEIEFSKAKSNNTVSSYQAYIDNYSKSHLISEAMYGYFVGDSALMGYSVLWEDLLNGKFIDFNAVWTNTVLFEEIK